MLGKISMSNCRADAFSQVDSLLASRPFQPSCGWVSDPKPMEGCLMEESSHRRQALWGVRGMLLTLVSSGQRKCVTRRRADTRAVIFARISGGLLSAAAATLVVLLASSSASAERGGSISPAVVDQAKGSWYLRSPAPSGPDNLLRSKASIAPSNPGVSEPEAEPSIAGDFTLTFNDEFEGDAIDGTKWRLGGTYMFSPGSAAIVPENAWVKDGSLWLKAEKRSSTFGKKSYKYSAAAITTYDHFSQRYGLWEARIRYDAIRGLWPAFWTMPDRGVRGRKAGYYRSFLKFDLSSLDGVAISAADLQLVVQSFEAPPPKKTTHIMVQPVPNDEWEESSIVWDSQPAPLPNWIHHQANPAFSIGGTYSVGITEYIQRQRDGDGVASLRIQDGFSHTYGVTFHSREADDRTLRPRLVVNGDIVLHPIADAYVRGGTYSSKNFGAEPVLISRDDWGNSESTHDGGMEMDIMEALGIWGKDLVSHAVHWDGYGAEHRSKGSGELRIPSTDDNFHTYAMYWEPGKISFFVDGTVTYVYESPRACSVPSYALLSLQMGGWGGNDKIDEESLPGFMEVDWVRIWRGTPREGS
jgi:beta-glucanase (GH16 family)